MKRIKDWAAFIPIYVLLQDLIERLRIESL